MLIQFFQNVTSVISCDYFEVCVNNYVVYPHLGYKTRNNTKTSILPSLSQQINTSNTVIIQ